MKMNSSASFVRKTVFIVENRGVFLEYFWNSQRTGRALRICTRNTYTHESPIFVVCGLNHRARVPVPNASDSYYWRTSHKVTKTL